MKNFIYILTLLSVAVPSVAQRSVKPWNNGLDRKGSHTEQMMRSLNLKRIHEKFSRSNQNLIFPKVKETDTHETPTVMDRVNGINVAWVNYGRDTGVDPTGGPDFRADLQSFEEIMDFVALNGGNVLRWWYHTNGSTNPVFGDNQMVEANPQFFYDDVLSILDLAASKGLQVQICLWSFDMLKDQWAVDATANKLLLTDDVYMEAYINNALVPLVKEVGAHPGLYAWEIFNEPEGMTNDYASHWPGFLEKISVEVIQKFINRTTGAIRRAQPGVRVTNGALGFLTNVEDPNNGYWNAYSDANLIYAGGDSDGYLDFYNIHYYSWAGVTGSPFHNAYDSGKIDKPTVIGEYYPDDLTVAHPTIVAAELGNKLVENFWAGSLVWSWSDRTSETERSNMATIIASVANGDSGSDTIEVTGVSIFPDILFLELGEQTALIASVIPVNTVTNLVSWRSADSDIVQVNGAGVVTAIGEGSTAITVTTLDGGHSSSVVVKVNSSGATEPEVSCENANLVDLPFSFDGEGTYCWEVIGSIDYINSWNCKAITVNGEDYTNVWSNIPEPIDGRYYIRYESEVPWGHFEANGSSRARIATFNSDDEQTVEKRITVYPNPSDGNFQLVNTDTGESVKVTVYTLSGELVFEEVCCAEELANINTSLGTGTYLLKVSDGVQVTVDRLFIR